MLSQGKVINLLPDELSTELCKYSEKNVCDQMMKYFKFYFTVWNSEYSSSFKIRVNMFQWKNPLTEILMLKT